MNPNTNSNGGGDSLGLQSLEFKGKPVRIVYKDGKPWWVAKDVCEQLGLSQVAMMVKKLKPHQKGFYPIATPGGTQSLTVISETGLYRCVMRCDKAAAEPFMDWITEEVVPSIMRTGSYSVPVQQALPAQEDAIEDETPALPYFPVERIPITRFAGPYLRHDLVVDFGRRCRQLALAYGIPVVRVGHEGFGTNLAWPVELMMEVMNQLKGQKRYIKEGIEYKPWTPRRKEI